MTATDVVLVDHHDSYTWNLAHLIAAVTGVLPTVVQHDETTLDELLQYSHVVLSPGPGNPDTAGDFAIGSAMLRTAARPVLGVCLGMQGLVAAYGGRIEQVTPGHGVLATVEHDGEGLFDEIPQRFRAVRYHSLAAVGVPSCLEVTARDEISGVVMGVRHRELPQVGVQFHPESVLSEFGRELIANFLGGST